MDTNRFTSSWAVSTLHFFCSFVISIYLYISWYFVMSIYLYWSYTSVILISNLYIITHIRMCICVCICICYLYTDHILGNRYIYIYIGTQAAGQLEQGLQPYLSILTIYYLSIQLGSWSRPFNPAGTRLERKKCGAPIPEKGNLKMSRFSVCTKYTCMYIQNIYRRCQGSVYV